MKGNRFELVPCALFAASCFAIPALAQLSSLQGLGEKIKQGKEQAKQVKAGIDHAKQVKAGIDQAKQAKERLNQAKEQIRPPQRPQPTPREQAPQTKPQPQPTSRQPDSRRPAPPAPGTMPPSGGTGAILPPTLPAARPPGTNYALPRSSGSVGTTYTPQHELHSPATTYTPHPQPGSAPRVPALAPGEPAPASAGKVYTVPPSAVGRPASSGGSVLTAAGSRSVVAQFNAARSNLPGLNQRPIPSGLATVHPNGRVNVATVDGRQLALRPDGTLASYSGKSATATFSSNGQIRELHCPSLGIRQGARGNRVVVSRLSGNRVVVSTGRRNGFVERVSMNGGRTLFQRTYVVHGIAVAHNFAGYRFHALELHHFIPAFQYPPFFYGWAYYPWGVPVVYSWTWLSAPWYLADGGYFVVSPRYPGASLWLADFFLSHTLAADYQRRLDDRDSLGDQLVDTPSEPSPDEAYAQAATPITDDVKQAIAEEIERQLAYENAAAAQPEQATTLSDLPQVLQPNRIFVADGPLNVIATDNQYCSLTGGDVLRLLARPDDGAISADLIVVSGKQGDCPAGGHVVIALQDLQEMQNDLRAQLHAGLMQLHDEQGRNGLPAAPPSAIDPPPRPCEYGVPNVDPNAAALVGQAQQQASREERLLKEQVFAPAPGVQ